MTAALATVEPLTHSARPDTEALGRQITELCGYLYAATYRLLVLIRDFDEQGGWEQAGLCSCAHWLNFKCGIGLNAAREKLRVARALKDLPKISAAFEQGRLSYSKVRAMTRIAEANNEDYLLMIAEHGTAYHVAALVSKYRRCQRLEDLENANRQHAERRVSYRFDADGCLVLNACLPAEQGALIVKALEMAIDAAEKKDVTAETSDEPAPGGTEAAAEPMAEPIAARRADALAAMAETYMTTEPVPNATADRYQVVVHVAQETLRRETSPDGSLPEAATSDHVTADTSLEPGLERAHLEGGPHVSADTSRRIACDCSTIRVVTDDVGEPLSIGRKSRSIPPAIRRALQLRDGGCRFPGCTHTRFVDGHHIEHWADGGETRLDNLVLLCRHHHRLVHEGGYGCERIADGRFVFTAPDRRVLPEHEPLPDLVLDRDPRRWLQRAMTELEIDAETCAPIWLAGDTIDWNMAVSALFASPQS